MKIHIHVTKCNFQTGRTGVIFRKTVISMEVGKRNVQRGFSCVWNLLFLKIVLSKCDKMSTLLDLAGGHVGICYICYNFLHKTFPDFF